MNWCKSSVLGWRYIIMIFNCICWKTKDISIYGWVCKTCIFPQAGPHQEAAIIIISPPNPCLLLLLIISDFIFCVLFYCLCLFACFYLHLKMQTFLSCNLLTWLSNKFQDFPLHMILKVCPVVMICIGFCWLQKDTFLGPCSDC